MERGKLIALLGVNHSGKSTQAKLLAKGIELYWGRKTFQIKYPAYEALHGEEIRQILQDGITDPYKLQSLCTQNRKAVEPEIQAKLDEGTWVIAEGYYPDTMIWGEVDDLPINKLAELVKKADFLEPDFMVVLSRVFPDDFQIAGHTNETDLGRLRRANFLFKGHALYFGLPHIQTTDAKGLFRDPHEVFREIIVTVF